MEKQTILLLLLLSCLNYLEASAINRLRKDREDFKKLLQDTQNGKLEEPSTPELEDLQNKWERSGKFQGDILLTDEQIDWLVSDIFNPKNAVNNKIRLWPNKTLYYNIEESYFNDEQLRAIQDGIDDLNEISCLNIVPRDNEKAYVNVVGNDDGCYTNIGYFGKRMNLNLAPDTPGTGCFTHGTIVHEFLHTLGFFHMQSANDRNDWIKVVWEKISPIAKINFVRYPSLLITSLGVDYDYGSVMHYTEYGFSIDGNKTMIPLKPTNATIGQRIGLSESDIIKLNKLYDCPGY